MPSYSLWKGSGIEGGGAVNSIAVNPTNQNVVLGGGDVFGIAVSTDGGETWLGKQKAARVKSELQVASVEWHPDGVQGFAAVGQFNGSGGLVYTKDGGATWAMVSTGFTMAGNQQGASGLLPTNHPRQVGKLIAVDAVNNLVYIGTWNRGIVRLTIQPSSTSWGIGTSIGLSGEYIRCLIIDDATPTTLYASTFAAIVSQSGQTRRITNANATPTITQMNSPVNGEEMVCLGGDLFGCFTVHPSQNGGVDDPTLRGVFRCPGKSTTAAWTHITGPDYGTVSGASASGTPTWKGLDGYVSAGVTTLYATTVAGYGDTAEGPRNGAGVYQPVWRGTSSTGFASDNGSWAGYPTTTASVSEQLPGPPTHLWWHGSIDGNAGNDLGGRTGGKNGTVSVSPGGQVVINSWVSHDRGVSWRPAFGLWAQTTMRNIAAHPNVIGAAIVMNTDYKAFGTGETIGPKAGSYFQPGAADHLTTPQVVGLTTGYVGVWDEVSNGFYLSLGNRDQYTQGTLYYNPAPLAVDGAGNPTAANVWTTVTHPAGTSQIINGIIVITRSNGIRRLVAFVKPSTAGGTDGGAYHRDYDSSGTALTGSWVAAATPAPLLDSQNTTLVPTSWRPGKPLVIYDRNSGVYKTSDEGATYTQILADASDIDAAGYARWLPTGDSILVTNDTGVYRIDTVSGTPSAPVSIGSPNMHHPGDIRITRAGNVYCLQRSDADGTLASCWATTLTKLNDPTIAAVDKWVEVGAGFDFSSGYPTNMSVDEGDGTGAHEVVYVSSRGGGVITMTVTAAAVDTVAPALAVTTPASNITVPNGTASQTVSGTATDNVGVTQVTVNTVPVTLAGGAFSTSVPLVVGSNTITVVARDAAGNRTTVTRIVTRQAVTALAPPVVNVTAPLDNQTFGAGTTAITLSGTATDSDGTIATVTYTLDGGAVTNVPRTGSTFTISVPIGAGDHSITVVVTDNDGLQDSQTVNFTVASPPPPPPPPPPPGTLTPPKAVGLGCADYQLWVYERGLRFDHGIGQLDATPGWTQLDWEIRLNDHSQATVTIANLRSASSECRGVFGRIRKWRHELVILRSDGRMWSGPIVRRQTQGGNGIITAYLPDIWLTRRDLILPHRITDADAMDLRDAYVHLWHDAILRDRVSSIAESYSDDLGYGLTISDKVGTATQPIYVNTKVKANSDIQADYNPMADEKIQGLVDQGLDWVTWDRRTIIGAPSEETVRTQLLDDHIAVIPDVDDDGTLTTNRYGVQVANQQGSGPPLYREAIDAGLQQRDGELVTIEQADTVSRPREAAKLATDRLATYGDLLPVISGAQLKPGAPQPISELVPGSLIDIRLFQSGIPVSGIYRITRLFATVTAEAGEVLEVELAPVDALDVEPG